MNTNAAAAAEKDGRPIRCEPRSVGADEQIGLELIAQAFADLAKVGRADFLTHLDNELGVETELAAARRAHRTKRGEIDAVLPLVVGGATPIHAIADPCRAPRIELI